MDKARARVRLYEKTSQDVVRTFSASSLHIAGSTTLRTEAVEKKLSRPVVEGTALALLLRTEQIHQRDLRTVSTKEGPGSGTRGAERGAHRTSARRRTPARAPTTMRIVLS